VPSNHTASLAAASGTNEASFSNWQLTRRLLRMSWRYRRRCVMVLALQLAVVLLALGGLDLAGLGIDYLRHQALPDGPDVRWPFGIEPPETLAARHVILLIAGAVLAMAVGRALLQFLAALTTARLVQDLIVLLRSRVYNQMQRLSFRFFDANASGTLINRVTHDVQQVRMFLDGVVLQSISLLIAITVYLLYMLSTHVWLTLACLATTPALWYACLLYGKKIKPKYREARELTDGLVRVVQENATGRYVVKGFSLQLQQNAAFAEANDHVRDQRHTIFTWHALFTAGVHLLTHLNLVILLGYGGWLVVQGRLALGQDLVVFAGLLQALSNQINTTAQISNSVQMSLTGAGRVFEILDASPEIKSPPRPKRLAEPRGEVALEQVTFGYTPKSPVLEEIDLHAPPGACVAVLGSTGAGKSTLLSLIPRFYDPQAGRVSLDGVDVRELELAELRRQIGIVFQQNFLFSNTVAANIAFGNPEASRERIEKAAEIACADEFIRQLPHGYETVVGENALDLSGGQRQRLAIARAILLEPRILILDDATAAVDPETESQMLTAMERAMSGRTTFVVAHRLSTLKRADLVVVLENGRIVQSGSHEELMTHKGLYRYAASIQAPDEESKRILGVS